ncbi:MAG: hypothetical protein KF767_05090 [Bdellovibrionaceae bacterium]|nr:hypothetical protein [Pseudobdellovibrionaceae bacterium]
MKPGRDRTHFCLTDLKENWILRNLSFGEVLAILASRPRSADADLLFWTEEWNDWKGLDDTECLPFRTPRVETQTPPPVPLVPILFVDPQVAAAKPTAKPAATPSPAAERPAISANSKKSKKRSAETPAPATNETWAGRAELTHPVLAEAAKAPSLSDLMRTTSAPKLSVNPEFQTRQQPAPKAEPPEMKEALPEVLSAPPAPGVVTIPEPVPLAVHAIPTTVPVLKPTAPPKLVTPSGKIVPPPPGFNDSIDEETPAPEFTELTRAPVGSREERTEVTSVKPMDRHLKTPPPREGGAALRKSERYAIQMPVIVQTTTEQFSTWTLDVSEGGIRTKDPLPDSLVGYAQVVLMPKNRAPFHLLASQVEDQADGRYHLQFMDSPAMVEFIAWMREQSWAA